jgi:hypothetical protein
MQDVTLSVRVTKRYITRITRLTLADASSPNSASTLTSFGSGISFLKSARTRCIQRLMKIHYTSSHLRSNNL